MKLLIKQPAVFDPKNAMDGEVSDLYIQDGIISSPFKNPDKIIEARGLWALPGGIETGSSFATYGLSFYGYKKRFPSPVEISRSYAMLGYTHVHEAWMFPTTALSVHHTLSSMPYQDTSASFCLTLREFGALIGSDVPPEWTTRFFETCAHKFRALNLRLPEVSAHFKESTLARYNLPARKVLAYIATLSLPFPLCVELTPRLLDEDLPHIPHLYYAHIGRAIDGEYAFKQVSTLITSKGITGDIGLAPESPHDQVKIGLEVGEKETLSAYVGMHSPLRYLDVSKSPQAEYALRLMTSPEYKAHLAFSTLCLGTEAGSHYPALFKRIFDASETYTLKDFILQTRILPAKQLGLETKGHLGLGAVGDVVLYKPGGVLSPTDILGQCHTLIKHGVPVIEQGRFVSQVPPPTYTYFRRHIPSERDLSMFANYFRHYPRLEHLDVPEALSSWKAIPLPEN